MKRAKKVDDKKGLVSCRRCSGTGKILKGKGKDQEELRCGDCKGTGDAKERKEQSKLARVSRTPVTIYIRMDVKTKDGIELLHSGKLGSAQIEYREGVGPRRIHSNELGFWSAYAESEKKLRELFSAQEARRIFQTAQRLGKQFIAQLKEEELVEV